MKKVLFALFLLVRKMKFNFFDKDTLQELFYYGICILLGFLVSCSKDAPTLKPEPGISSPGERLPRRDNYAKFIVLLPHFPIVSAADTLENFIETIDVFTETQLRQKFVRSDSGFSKLSFGQLGLIDTSGVVQFLEPLSIYNGIVCKFVSNVKAYDSIILSHQRFEVVNGEERNTYLDEWKFSEYTGVYCGWKFGVAGSSAIAGWYNRQLLRIKEQKFIRYNQ